MFVMPPVFNSGDTIYFPFDTYDANGASVTITGLAVTDIEIYKNGGTTQRASDNGYALLDTDGIDFDGATGLHGFSVDTSDNSDAGFWADGAQYWVNVNAITVAGQTVRFTYFLTLGYLLRPTTAGRKIDVSTGGEAGVDWANVGTPGSTVNLSATTVNLVNTLTTYTGNTPQTGDCFSRLGAPAGASVSADILTIDNLIDDVESRLGTPSNLGSGATVAANLVDIEAQTDDIGVAGAGLTDLGGMSTTMKAQIQTEAEDALISHHVVLVKTTIATLASQTSFTLTAGSADNDAYNDCDIVIEDSATSAQKATAVVDDYVGATKTVTLRTDPAVFTMAVGDIVTIRNNRALKPTVDKRTADVTATGAVGVDWGNVENAGSTVSLTATTIATVTTTTTATNVTTVNGLAAGVITAAAIADNAIDAGAIAADAITAAKIATGAITAAKFAAGAIDAAALASDVINDIWAGTALTESYRSANATGTPAQLLYEILQNITEFAISGTTKTVKKLDGSTSAKTYTLDSATIPTSITETT